MSRTLPDVEYDKYNFAKNPLMHPDGQQNKSVSPAFDVDSTDFIRAGTKALRPQDENSCFLYK